MEFPAFIVNEFERLLVGALVPVHRGVAYGAMAALVLAPKDRISTSDNLSLTTIFTACVCASNCLTVYRRDCLSKYTPVRRCLYAVMGSLGHLGASALTWFVIKKIFKNNNNVAFGLSMITCFGYYCIASRCLDIMDRRFRKQQQAIDASQANAN